VKANVDNLGELESFDPEAKVPFDANFFHDGCLERHAKEISKRFGEISLGEAVWKLEKPYCSHN
jgi:hypothetical protein